MLEAKTLLREAGDLPDTPGGWRRYLDYLGVLAEEDAKRREKKFGRLSRGWLIGSAGFRQGLKAHLNERTRGSGRFELLGADATAQREARAELWEEKLQRAAKALGIDLIDMPAQRSAPAKVRLAACLKAASSVSNTWLADRLQMGLPASVSQYVRRFRLSGGLEERRFKLAISNLAP